LKARETRPLTLDWLARHLLLRLDAGVLGRVGGAEGDETPSAPCSRQRRARHQDRAATGRRSRRRRIAAGSVL